MYNHMLRSTQLTGVCAAVPVQH